MQAPRSSSSRNRVGSKAGVALAAACAATLLTARVGAQEHDQFFFSDDAALAAGAVGATTSDSGSVYYNPAGLALNRRTHADLKASAFGIRIRPVDGVVTQRAYDQTSKLNLHFADILSVPLATGVTRRVGENMSFGFGFYVVDYDVRAGEDTATIKDSATGATVRDHIDVDLQRSKYVFGPAIGWQVSPGFRMGVGLYGTYSKVASGGRVFADGSAPPAFLFVQSRGNSSSIGARGTIGVQWDFRPSWSLGLTVRTPEVRLANWGSALSAGSWESNPPGDPASPAFSVGESRQSHAVTLSMPPQLVASVAYKFEGGFVAAELDLQPPLRVISEGIDRETTLNARVGCVLRVSRGMSLGTGFFTDRAISPLAAAPPSEHVDYYGATFGAQLRTFLGLAQSPENEPLVLTTTVALRAAIGFGDARAYDFNVASTTTRVTFYEFVPYLGSSITF